MTFHQLHASMSNTNHIIPLSALTEGGGVSSSPNYYMSAAVIGQSITGSASSNNFNMRAGLLNEDERKREEKRGCFIATAAYGSYLDSNVKILQDFRDVYLLTNTPGKMFVALYEKYSPPLATIITDNKYLKIATRIALTPILYSIKYPLLSMPIFFLLLISIGYKLRKKFISFNAWYW